MLKTFWAIFCLWICGVALTAHAADNYSLADGTTLTGDIVTFNDAGIMFRLPDEKYTERMPWTKFSQAGLEQLAQNPKIKPLVEPFMELPPVVKAQQKDDIKVNPVKRLELPKHEFLLGALASSSVGLLLLILIYAANLYAAYEVASCRARPLGTVIGISAVLPVVGPAIFFAMRTNLQSPKSEAPVSAEGDGVGNPAANAAALAAAAVAAGQDPANPSPEVFAAVAAAARAARAARASSDSPEGAHDAELEGLQISAVPTAPKEEVVSQSYKRGQFTFNRRFFETKFPGFMQPTRSEADQKLEFTVKLAQTSYVVQRISRIGMNEVHFEVLVDQQSQEVMVPFGDIQEITIKSKTA